MAPLTPSVDRHFLAGIMASMSEIGIDAQRICSDFGLKYPLEEQGERVPLALVSSLYEAIGNACQDPEFVYKLGSSVNFAGAGTLFQLVSCCENMLTALQLVSRYSAIVSDAVKCSFGEHGRTHVDLLVIPNRAVYVTAHQLEGCLFALSRFHRMTTASQGPLLKEIWFTHAPRFPVARYEAYFGCAVHFHQNRTGARLLRKALETPFPGADKRLQNYYRSAAENYETKVISGNGFPEQVQQIFLQRMAFGEPNREDIANALNISVRTLQRNLRSAGLSYRELTDQARMGAARQELQYSDRPMHEIAFLLGYSDARVFRRAFQRWTGSTPVDFRKQRKIMLTACIETERSEISTTRNASPVLP